MKKSLPKRILALLLAFIIALLLPACSDATKSKKHKKEVNTTEYLPIITEDDTANLPKTTEKKTQKTTVTTTTTTTKSTTKSTKKFTSKTSAKDNSTIKENGKYDTKDEVALYIHKFGHLPSNYITKRQAEDMGWSGGSLKNYAPGCSIGGDRFGNYEGKLPKVKGRTYKECDIGTMNAKSRGAKRIIFSNDGLIYYTSDHYETFTKLY